MNVRVDKCTTELVAQTPRRACHHAYLAEGHKTPGYLYALAVLTLPYIENAGKDRD